MNQAIVTGMLKGEPRQGRKFLGQRRYWFSLTVEDNEGDGFEVIDIVGTEAMIGILKLAASQNKQVIVHGSLHNCKGWNLGRPGDHKYILAGQIAPFDTASYRM